jgi:intracellular septation protein
MNPDSSPSPPVRASASPFSQNLWRDLLLAVVILVSGLIWGIFTATVIGAVGALVLVAWNWIDLRRVDWVMLGVGLTGVGFALLALVLKDDSFVKYRPTFTSAVVAVAILVLMSMNVSFTQRTIGAFYIVPDDKWRKMDLVAFAYMGLRGALNWWVASSFPDSTWLWYTTFVSKGIGMAYGLGMVLYINMVKVRENDLEAMLPPRARRPAWLQRWVDKLEAEEAAAKAQSNKG